MPILNQEDLRTPTWRKIKEWAEAELVQLRINLEADQPQERTIKIRGQIRSLNLLLGLEVSQPPVEDDN